MNDWSSGSDRWCLPARVKRGGDAYAISILHKRRLAQMRMGSAEKNQINEMRAHKARSQALQDSSSMMRGVHLQQLAFLARRSLSAVTTSPSVCCAASHSPCSTSSSTCTFEANTQQHGWALSPASHTRLGYHAHSRQHTQEHSSRRGPQHTRAHTSTAHTSTGETSSNILPPAGQQQPQQQLPPRRVNYSPLHYDIEKFCRDVVPTEEERKLKLQVIET